MGWNDHIEFEFANLMQEVIEGGDLEEGTPAYGIALFAADFGYDSLSSKQKYIYDKEIAPAVADILREREQLAAQDRWDKAG